MLQGPYSGLDRDRPLVRMPFAHVVALALLLALTGFIACIFISLVYHLEESTFTHCRVSNYLPSISAAISQVPERYIWRCCIGLHSAPRYLITFTYFSFYRRRFEKLPERLLTGLTFLCSLAENSGLLLLTSVASTETYSVHKNAFIVFIASSLLHMLSTCRLWQVIKRHYINPEEVTSYHWKLRIFLFNISCCAVAAYFFRRHNKYCEEGVYTLFAFFEYMVVLSNMAFHLTAVWDFENKEMMVATPPEDKRY